MANFMGREMTRSEILNSVGHLGQLAGVRPLRYDDGRAGGCRAMEVTTGGGLRFTVLPDKCMDLFALEYKGVNLSFLAKPGLTAPQYFNPHNEFYHYAQGGLLFTCGLRSAGAGSVDGGETHTLHGRIGNTPAEHVAVHAGWQGDEYDIRLEGEMRESALFGENLVLHRTIETGLGRRSITVTDRVDNESHAPQDLMLLYHINFGFPFLSADTDLLLPAGVASAPRDADAAKGLDAWQHMGSPQEGYREQVFYHTMPAATDGTTAAVVWNRKLELAVVLRYNVGELPVMNQWKCLAAGDYALGLEPANCHVEGKVAERQRGTLQSIEGFGSRRFTLHLEVWEGEEISAGLQALRTECGLVLQ